MAVEPKEKRKSYLFDFLNSVSHVKDNLLETVEEKEYNAYMMNRYLSMAPDTILFAQEMNQRYNLPKALQYDYLRSAIRKKKRFFKYTKSEKEEHLGIVREYFGYSISKAKEALELLSTEDLEYIEGKLDKGGAKKTKVN